ncbi:MAG: hypothetical protein QG620_623 [Patescibacteria group bacterium]|nr:hypothetical protein [Patescibacteria group bacterium]
MGYKQDFFYQEIIEVGKMPPHALVEWLAVVRGQRLLDLYLAASSLSRVVAPECADKAKAYSILAEKLEQRIRSELDLAVKYECEDEFCSRETEADTFVECMCQKGVR